MDNITITEINREEAFRYMAAEGFTPDGVLADLADECEKRIIETVRPRYTYKVYPIESNNGSETVLSGFPAKLEGKDISNLLEGCHSAVVMCATIGAEADALIRRMQAEDMAKAVMTDSFASVAAEQVCNAFDEIIREKYPDKFITWRFSPGYGDFPISIQKKLLEALNAMRLAGVCLNPSGMLTPVKSVTAVCGISDHELPKRRRGCASCTMKGRCAYRKRGTRCEF